ncbi:hypothetical protein M513_01424, partial [Trichuris suis]
GFDRRFFGFVQWAQQQRRNQHFSISCIFNRHKGKEFLFTRSCSKGFLVHSHVLLYVNAAL